MTFGHEKYEPRTTIKYIKATVTSKWITLDRTRIFPATKIYIATNLVLRIMKGIL